MVQAPGLLILGRLLECRGRDAALARPSAAHILSKENHLPGQAKAVPPPLAGLWPGTPQRCVASFNWTCYVWLRIIISTWPVTHE